MGNTSTAVSAATAVNINLKPQTQDWGVTLVTKTIKGENGAPDKIEQSLKAVQGEKEIEDARKKGTLQFVQTISFDFPANDAGQQEVIPDAEERNDTFIAGLKASRINPRVRRALEDFEIDKETEELVPKFTQIEGMWDIRDLIKEAAKRKNLTPKEKAYKNLREIPALSHMTDAQLDMLMASAPGLVGAVDGTDSATEEGNSSEEMEQAEADAATTTA